MLKGRADWKRHGMDTVGGPVGDLLKRISRRLGTKLRPPPRHKSGAGGMSRLGNVAAMRNCAVVCPPALCTGALGLRQRRHLPGWRAGKTEASPRHVDTCGVYRPARICDA